jgi:hypothetical protein
VISITTNLGDTKTTIAHPATTTHGRGPRGRALCCSARIARSAWRCAALFARGHLLIEDLPGVGKTTLAHDVDAGALGLRLRSACSSPAI